MRPRANERDRPLCYHFLRSLLDSRTVARLVASRALVYNSFGNADLLTRYVFISLSFLSVAANASHTLGQNINVRLEPSD